MKYSLRQVVDELRSAMQQTLITAKIEDIQIAYWITVIGDRLKSQHLGKRRSQQFLNTFPDIPIIEAKDNTIKNAILGRKYVVIPSGFYNFDLDRGINYVAFYNPDPECKPEFVFNQFTRTSQVEAPHLYNNRFEKPSSTNAYWYINGQIMTFLGLEKTDVDKVEIGMFTTFDPVSTADIDADFEFPQELFSVLQRQVIDLGRFVMMIPKDRLNDATDTTGENGQVPTQKIVSVNQSEEV